MRAATAFSAAAVMVAFAFAATTFERWQVRRRPHELAWALSMALFAAGALAFFFGLALGWSAWSFKLFYLLGGVLTVPALALGTVYLLAGRRWGNRISLVTGLIGAFAVGVVLEAPLQQPLDPYRLNSGKEVLGIGPRILAAAGSALGASVVIVGAVWSAWRLARGRARPGATAPSAALSRLAAANVLIAAGTLLISLKRPFEIITGSGETGFAVALTVGLSVMFAGFLLAGLPARSRAANAAAAPAAAAQAAAAPAS
jgi:hypothetical protein